MPIPAHWWRTLVSLTGLACVSLFLGLVLDAGSGWMLLALGLAVLLARHLYQILRLERWLAAPEGHPPSASGGWGVLLQRLDALVRRHNEAQQRSLSDLEQLLNAARLLPDGVVILDAGNRILWCNRAAQEHLGLREKGDRGQFITYLVRSAAFAAWLARQDGEPLTMDAPGAQGRTLNLQLVPLPHDQRMLLSRDITEFLRVDAMRRDFVANISHELRTPITVIMGFLEAFADMERPDPQQFRNHVQLMLEQSERMRRLLDDLLTLARLEADNEPEAEAVDLPALARSLVKEAEGLSGGRHEIKLELLSTSHLLGNLKEIHSALGNLVSNAVRYTPAGGRITLRWRDNGYGGAEFSVSDTGEGIEPQHIPRLTERFYRVDRGRSRATGGTGLGLAIVKHVLQRHQGRLRIESTVGKGSTFTAVFPAERLLGNRVQDTGYGSQ